MKYLVHETTKEHVIWESGMPTSAPGYKCVEADEDGWIPWGANRGSSCPLPDRCKVAIKYNGEIYDEDCAGYWWWNDVSITAYRPILETSESQLNKGSFSSSEAAPGGIAVSSLSVFDRLKSAIAASESIPAIIAEIDAMLPEGYRVVKRGVDWAKGCKPKKQSANDMSDWRNWREGDLVTAHGLRGGYTENAFPENVPHTIVAKRLSGFYVKSSNGDVLYFHGMEISRGELKFHSRPAKVTE